MDGRALDEATIGSEIARARRPPPGGDDGPLWPGWSAFFDAVIARSADAEFLVYDTRTGERLAWSYRAFAAEVERVGGVLADDLGRRPGDRVATATVNQPEAVFVSFAAWRRGLCLVPINAAAEGRPGRRGRAVHVHGEAQGHRASAPAGARARALPRRPIPPDRRATGG